MTFTVDEETVPADADPSRSRLDPAQVDPANGELAQDVHQRAGVVVGEERDDRGSVGPRRSRERSRGAELHEPGDRTGPVMYLRGEDRKLVMSGGEAAGQRGIELAIGDLAGRVGVGQCGLPSSLRQVLGEPAPALRLRDRVPAHDLDVGHRRARPGQQGELDRDEHLGLDRQRRPGGELVQGGVHPALDRALDRHHGPVGLISPDRVDRGRDGRVGDRLVLTVAVQGADRLLTEGASRPEVSAALPAHDVTATGCRAGQSQMTASTTTVSRAAGVTAVLTTVSSQPRPAGSGMPRAGR